MIDISILAEPFMIRAMIASIFVAITSSSLGVFVIARDNAFFTDAIAHAALLGIACALLVGIYPPIGSLLIAVLISALLPVIERRAKVNHDTLLALILPFSMALAVVIISIIPGYKPDLMSFLFGNILAISWGDITIISLITTAVLGSTIFFFKKFALTTIDPIYANIIGINTFVITIILNMLLALAIIPSISMVGAILVGALVVFPTAIAKQVARSLRSTWVISVSISSLISVMATALSALVNTPTGPTIVLVLSLVFVVVTALNRHSLVRISLR